MSEKMKSILFLGFVALILVGFLVSITILIVRRAGRGQVYKRVAAKYGWSNKENAQESVEAVRRILEPTLFAMRKGKHEISQVISGQTGGTDFNLVRYHYRELSPHEETQRGNTYVLLVFPRRVSGPELWFTHRQKGVLAAVAERVAGSRLKTVDDPAWSWALVSSSESFSGMDLDSTDGHSLEELTEPGDSVFIFADTIVYSSQGELRSSWAETVSAKIGALVRIFGG